MRNKRNFIWLVVLLIITLTLVACVRPVPQPEIPVAPETDPSLVMTLPPVQPEQPAQPEQPLPTPIEGEALPVATPVSAEPTLETIPTAAPAQEQIHTVQAGDTLGEIAGQYGVTVDEIVAANDITNVDQLSIGQQLIIPAPGSVAPTATAEVVAGETPEAQPEATVESASEAGGTHVVQLGENLYRIGLKYGCSVDQMAAANGIVNPSRIAAGQVLQIPDCN